MNVSYIIITVSLEKFYLFMHLKNPICSLEKSYICKERLDKANTLLGQFSPNGGTKEDFQFSFERCMV